ncbi:PGPGW domain-containing protein [Chelativorans sp.]|uniref:PGPGW domain-containing protein n=1 Tax=Chelativorans sp. TaxID=2203393 RepID=UPI00281104C6|nr:PGPGW domain-containing protein [Chelativorans sp.]
MLQQHNPPDVKPEPTDAAEAERPHIPLAGRKIPMPRSRLARILIGALFVILGIFGFLPVLGFWMVPLGLFILSYDVPAARRLRRRLEVWWHRRRERMGRRPSDADRR